VVDEVGAPETMGVLNFPSETMGVLNFPVLKLWVSLIFPGQEDLIRFYQKLGYRCLEEGDQYTVKFLRH